MAKLNEEICDFIGAFIGDEYFGNYGKLKNTYTVGIVGHIILDDYYLKNYLFHLVQKNFPYTNPLIYYRKNENTINLRMNSKLLFNFFLSLGFKLGKKSLSATIPREIIKNKRFLRKTIRGLFDTDGSVFFDKRPAYKEYYPSICLKLHNKQLIKQVYTFLASFQINATVNRDYGRVQNKWKRKCS